ncbi:tyrosine-type recombinase/integrase [Agromyces sp. NPDC055658]
MNQRHKPCTCERVHGTNCTGNGRCRCPRVHTAKCPHRIRPDGKTACGCPWAYSAETSRNGKRVATTGSGYTSKTAAMRARAEALETLKRAPLAARRGETLGDFLESWMKRKSTGSNALRASTLVDYERYVATITEAIGGTRLRDVTPDTLDDLERHLHRANPAATTAHARAFAVLQSALRDAYRRGLILDDPTRRRDAVRAPKRTRKMLQPEEFSRLIAWMQRHDERLAAVFWVAVATGLRRGEICGLRWVDVDLDRHRLIVEQQAVQIGREIVVGAPKTRAGEGRVVMLDDRTVEVLRSVQAQQAADAAEWGDLYANDALLVFTREDGTGYVPEQLTAGLPRMIKRFNFELRIASLPANDDELATLAKSRGMGASRLAAIRLDPTLTGSPLPVVSLHSLRHLSASLLLGAGRGLAAVQRRLGHSSITVTSDLYGHLVESLGREDATVAMAQISPQISPES